VVGLKGLLHTGVVLSGKTKLHGVRLAQGSEIKLELRAATSALALFNDAVSPSTNPVYLLGL